MDQQDKYLKLYKEYFTEFKTVSKEGFDIFTVWISSLTWFKFFVFLILVSIVSGQIQEFLSLDSNSNFLDLLTVIFIVVSVGMKVLMNSKVKSDKRANEAIVLAEKEALLRQLSEAKVQVMQAQIEPHFLFNTLSSIQFLMSIDTKKAQDMLENLSTYLRYALPTIRENKSMRPLQEEVKNISAYLEIMKVRMGERLNVIYDIPLELNNIEIPVMMLQPIIENSIKHGIEESIEGGIITVSARRNDNNILINITDTGKGLSEHSNKKGNGMALKNIKERLSILYGDKANLIIKNNNPHGVDVEISLPV